MVKPITKFQIVVKDPNHIKSIMERAIIEMLSGRKGPVWIEVPLDIQGSEYIEENQIHLNIETQIKKTNFKSDQFQSWAPELH